MKPPQKIVFLKSFLSLFLILSLFLAPLAPIFAQQTSVDIATSVLTEQKTSIVSNTEEEFSVPQNETVSDTTQAEIDVADEVTDTNDQKPKEEVSVDQMPIEELEPEMMMSSYGSQEYNPENLTAGLTENKKGFLEADKSSGALNYSFPITVPPGRNGMEPGISLDYNNQQIKNYPNLIGYGWNINIPYIERINKTGTDKLYTSDYFYSSLSGELVQVSSGVYAPKVENGNFIKYSFASNVWTLTDKSGTVYKLGTTASERQDDPSNSSKIYKWMLQEVRDTNDNYVKYKYYKNGGQIYPDTITYTGNGSADGIFEVEFTRESRSDVNKSYATAFLVTTNYRIDEIITKVRGAWVKKYTTAYTTGDNGSRSLLSSITESGQDESSNVTILPATSFSYYTATPGWVETNSVFTAPVTFGSGFESMLDINGDSYDDIIYSYGTVISPIKNTYINNNNGTWSLDNSLLPPVLFRESEVRGGAYQDQWDQGVRMGDVNGDLLPDIIKSEDNANSNGGYDAYLNTNGSSWTQNSSWNPTVTFNGDANITTWGSHFIDLNGDGLMDIIKDLNGQAEQINTGTAFGTSGTAWDPPVALGGPNMQFADVNGDGLPDIIHVIWTNSGNTRTPLLYLNKGDGTWSQDNSFFPPVDIADSTNHDTGIRFFDVNNDGLADAVSQYNSLGGNGHGTYLNTGQGWSLVSSWNVPDYQINFNTWGYINTSDLNTDGSIDFLTTHNSSPHVTRAFLNNTTVPTDTLKRVTFPQGGYSETTYKKSAKYFNGSTLLNPDLPVNIDTVYQMVTVDSNGNTSTDTYSYEGGLYYYNNPVDRKIVGFAKVTKTDSVGTKVINYFHQGDSTNSSQGEYSDHISKAGKIYRTEVTDSSGNIYQKTVNKWDKYNQGTDRDFVKLTRKTILTYDGDGDHKDVATEYVHSDTYGNITTKTMWGEVNASDDGSFTDTGSDKAVETIYYTANTTDWIVGLLYQNTLVDQSSAKVQETKIYYDGQSLGTVTNGNVTKVEKWEDGSTYVNTQKTYNTTYGIPTSSTDEEGNVTEYAYDLYNLYPQIVENPLNQIVKYFYNYSSGKIKQKNDSNNKVTQYKYDGLNRLLEEKISIDIGIPDEPLINPVVEALVVGGGGAGGGNANGSHSGGGGGAGGFVYEYFLPLSVQSYGVTIGKGGRGAYGPEDAENSVFANLTAIRGGRGGNGYEAAIDGGSGGGAHVGSSVFGLGTYGQGHNGGEKENTYGGGGGGSGFVGGNASSSTGGSGGDGLPNPILGSTSGENISGVYYLAGGGGGYGYNQGLGGKGGGGDGAHSNCGGSASAGLSNTGGGGGAACWNGYGSQGGSGVVVISYAEDGSDGVSDTSTGGNVTTYNGRVIHTFNSNGTFNLISSYVPSIDPPTMKLKTAYTYNDTQGAVSVLKTDYLDDSNSALTYQYFDGLNRLIQERKEMEESSEYSVKDIKYNTRGLIDKESVPYTSSGSSKTSATTTNNLYKNYAYDPVNRVISISDNIGTTNNVYDDWKTTATDPNGNIKHYYKDAYGNLVQVDEVNGSSTYTTSYEWNLNKNLTKITDALGNLRNFTYDGLGRRLTAEDLHASGDTTFGEWSYSYDDVGNLTQSVSPESKTVNYTYDDINRVLTENETGGSGTEITYTYDSCTNGIGKLCSVTMLSGADVDFTYDAIGNIASEIKTINSIAYTTSYTYDRLGNKLVITYPDDSEVKYTYNTAGQLEKIERKESGGSYVDVVLDFDYGPHGKIIYQENSNDTYTENTYDADKLYRLTNKKTTVYSDTEPSNNNPIITLSESELINIDEDDVWTEPGYSASDTEDGDVTSSVAVNGSVNTAVPGIYQLVYNVVDSEGAPAIGLTRTVVVHPLNIPTMTLKALVIAGGGGGGYRGGGGGAGGYQQNDSVVVSPGDYTITVGSGGNGSNIWSQNGANGGNSSFDSLINSVGGGGGASYSIGVPNNGGSGGGATNGGGGGSATSGQGYNGGNGGTDPAGSGGGGGAGAIGSNNSGFSGGNGGGGTSSSITGSSVTRAGGGGGGAYLYGSSGTGGSGGGANGGVAYTAGSNAPANTGGGGGGGGVNADGGNGGSGLVVVRYVTSDFGTSTGGTITTDGTDTIHTFNSSGTFTAVAVPYTPPTNDNPEITLTGSNFINLDLNDSWSEPGYSASDTEDGNITGDVVVTGSVNTSIAGVYQLIYNVEDGDGAPAIGLTRTIVVHPISYSVYAQNQSYVYDASGNITQITDTSYSNTSKVVDYIYDDLNRMTSATATDVAVGQSTYTHTYTYNAIGNITSGPIGSYVYDGETGSNWANPHAATSIDSVTNTYDKDGNLLDNGTLTNTWNYKQQLIESDNGVDVLEYWYDHEGQRVRAKNGSDNTYYVNNLYNVDPSGKETKSIYAGDSLVATIETTSTVVSPYYVHADHLGSTNVVTDDTGYVVELLDYFPYGNQRISNGSYTSQKKSLGQIYDVETDLNYYNARYMSGEQGRFISQDPVFWEVGITEDGKKVLINPQLQNSYSYAGGNPIKDKDPSGRIIETPIDAFMLSISINEFRQNPTPSNALGVIFDGISLAMPGIPAVGGSLLRVANKTDTVIDAGKIFKNSEEVAKGGVYTLTDPKTGAVVRTGRTNDLARRQFEHGRNTATKDLEFNVNSRTDDYATQRGLEQVLHNTYNPSLNKINPISPSNPNLSKYIEAAKNFLNSNKKQ